MLIDVILIIIYIIEKCSLNCYEPKNHTRISCENGFSSYRLKRSNRIILEHPVGKQNLPKSVEHLRCLKTFSCQRPTDKPPATSTLTPFPPDGILNFYDFFELFFFYSNIDFF